MTIDVTYFNDPACPWGYSASPPLAVLRWRYRDQLSWRLVTIGLTDTAEQYTSRGYTPLRAALSQIAFRRYGMPFAPAPKARVSATGRACRTVVATRLRAPESEEAVFRALQLAWFTTGLILDEDRDIELAIESVSGIDARTIVASLDDPEVSSAYEADRALARSASGGATEFQGKAAQSDGSVRYTAPSLIFTGSDGRSLEAGGFQTIEAYDVLIANLDRSLTRHGPADSPDQALALFPRGLVTQEVAAIMAHNNQPPDRAAAETALVELTAAGSVRRTPLGDDALWQLA